MQDHYDILIVGGRCAGSAAAIGLGRAGYRVLLIERQPMPSDTISSHVMWPDGVAALDRLGLLDQMLATGAPPVRHYRRAQGEEIMLTKLIPYLGVDYYLCVRRPLMDGILFEAAAATPGVDAVDSTRLDQLTFDGERVTGGQLVSGGKTFTVTADLVIGADGRDSTVARQVGAVEDDVVPRGRYWYYSYFSGAREPEPLALTQSDTETDTAVSMATDSDLQMVIYAAYDEDFHEFRRDYEKNYLERVMAHPFMRDMLADATLEAPVVGLAGIRGFYRTAWGSGWVLIGDAVHLKNPIVARGINDAFLQAEFLSAVLRDGISEAGFRLYERWLRETTAGTSQTARMLLRPDQYMSADQAEILTREGATPEGLARILGLEYGGVTQFADFFMTGRDRVVEVPAER